MPRCGKYTSYEFTFVFPFRSQKIRFEASMAVYGAVYGGLKRY